MIVRRCPPRLWLLLAASLAAAGCDGRASPTPAREAGAATPAGAEPALQVLRSGPVLAAAFADAYGGPPPIAARGLDPESPDESYTIEPSGMVVMGRKQLLVSSVRNDETAHAFVGGISLHVFTVGDDGRRTVVASAPLITGGNGFGEPAPWELRNDLFATPALVVKSGWGGGGCVSAYETVFEPLHAGTTPVAPRILVRHHSETADETMGVIAAEVPGRSFTVAYSGATVRTVRFVRAGGRFEADGDTEGLPGC